MNSNLVEFIPHNMQEHDDMLRAIANKHMGAGQGNVSIWVIQALHEAYKSGFGLGYTTAQNATRREPMFDPTMRREREMLRELEGRRPDDVVDAEVTDVTPRQLPRPKITLRREPKT